MQRQRGRGGVVLCFWSKPSAPPPHGNSFDKEQGGAGGGGWSQQPLSPHQRKCAWAGGGGWGLFPVPADWGPCPGTAGRRAGPLASGGAECWVWCGRCSCFLLWRASNLQKKLQAETLGSLRPVQDDQQLREPPGEAAVLLTGSQRPLCSDAALLE